MALPMIVTGDKVALPIQLTKNGATFIIASGASVKAGIVDQGHKKLHSAVVTCSNTAPGADWNTSLVTVEMTSAESGAIDITGDALIEIEIDEGPGEPISYFADVSIVAGLVT